MPGGLRHNADTFPDTGGWKDKGKNATVHLWRKSHWANWMFDVDEIDEVSRAESMPP